MSKRDYYEILGVSKDATDKEIKKAYREKAMKYHPDKNPGDKKSEEKFKESAEAYDILSDPKKRQRYDQFGHASTNNNGFSNMEDIFSHFGDIFNNGFGFTDFTDFGFKRNRKNINKGSNIRITIELTLEEIIKGVSKTIKINKYVPCHACNGSGAKNGQSKRKCQTCKGNGYIIETKRTILGRIQTQTTCPKCSGEGTIIVDKCPYCNGNGVIRKKETITIDIPAGVSEGMQLSFSGKGNAAHRGGINGDLLVVIKEIKHSKLIRDNDNLIYDLNLSIPDVILGKNVEIPTVIGKVKIKIDPGTYHGKILKLKGKGIPKLNSYGKGDLLIHVSIFIPKKLDKEEKYLIEKLKDSENFKPRK